LKLFPLVDKSDIIKHIEDTVTSNLAWIGAVYYRIIEKNAFGNNYYTLLGYDENNFLSNKKIIEVLSFKDGNPVFGGSYFSIPNSGFSKTFTNRFIMEYKKHAGPRLNYDADEDVIMIEHLISESGQAYNKETLVPDGDYDAMKWINGKWVYITKVYTYKLKDGEAPVPHPLNPENGKMDTKQFDKDLEEADKEEGEVNDSDSTTTNTKVAEPKKKKKKKED
jgi:hypothetical protein